MKVTRNLLQNLLRDDSAAGMLEYALLAALLVLAAYVALHHWIRKSRKITTRSARNSDRKQKPPGVRQQEILLPNSIALGIFRRWADAINESGKP